MVTEHKEENNRDRAEKYREEAILFLAGICLVMLQFFMIREMTALLLGTEIVIFIVTISYFLGYSVGYYLAGVVTTENVRKLAPFLWMIHLTMPFSLRYLSGFTMLHVPLVAPVLLTFIMVFVLSSFFSILLPRFVDSRGGDTDTLVRLYSVELAGAIVGVVMVLSLGTHTWAQPIIYQAALGSIAALLWNRRLVWVAMILAVAAYSTLFSRLEAYSLSYYYSSAHGIAGNSVLYSVNSPYQKVDMIRAGSGRRYIFLDGNQNYGSDSLRLFNKFLSRLPAALTRPSHALVVGAGSMQSLRYVSPLAGWVDIVELDGAVPRGSMRHMADINLHDRTDNWRLIIQDAKKFLGEKGTKYDLIIMDVPAPLNIQVGLLHSVEFYKLARGRLSPGGIISVSLSGRLRPGASTPKTVAAALLNVFDDVVIHTPDIAGRSFAIAGDKVPFTDDRLRLAASKLGARETIIFNREKTGRIVGRTPPISLDHISYPVKRSWRRVKIRYLK